MPLLKKDSKHPVQFELNGVGVVGYAEPRTLLSDFLRKEMALTGVHVGCEHGVCGCCTVRVDGKLARSCLMYAVQVEGRSVKTVEDLAEDSGELNDLQKAFKKHHALQCGQCTPGVLMSCDAYLEENPDPNEEEIREMLSGHICRCTGYTGMVRAVKDVVESRKSGS